MAPTGTRTRQQGQLAIEGGPKAFPGMQGTRRSKIGVEEFLSIAERFGFSPEALDRIRLVISDEDLGRGPTLSRFLTADPPRPKGEAYEALARDIFGSRFALATSSGTGALHAAMVAVGVGPGTECRGGNEQGVLGLLHGRSPRDAMGLKTEPPPSLALGNGGGSPRPCTSRESCTMTSTTGTSSSGWTPALPTRRRAARARNST